MQTDLELALNKRFLNDEDGDYLCDMKDIATHGIAGGFSGFIYSTELCEFFDEHESDIEDLLHDMDISLNDIVADPESWTYQEVKERSVWIAVEEYCSRKVDEFDNADVHGSDIADVVANLDMKV